MGGLLGWIPDLLGMDKDSPFRHLVGLASMGLIGYGVYYGVKQLTSGGDSAPTPSEGQSGSSAVATSGGKKIYCSQTAAGERCVRSDGAKVEYRNGQWVVVGESMVISIDPTFTKGVDTRQTSSVSAGIPQNPDEGHDVYQTAYDSFVKSKSNGTLKVQVISDSTWAKKYTTEDGKVILKDTKGNLATKNSSGKWVITSPSGQYVATVGTKTRIQNVATSSSPQVSRL